MDWTQTVDIYCERVSAAFWSEPLNAVTNAAFIIAAIVAYVAARRRDRLEGLTIAMIAVTAAVGVGSFLFHTFATRWAGAADTAPIMIFILIYIYAATRRFLGAPVWLALAAVVAFPPFAIAFGAGWDALLPSLNGSEGYFPVFVFLAGYGVALALMGHPAARGLLLGAVVFALSLTFRSIDSPVCGALPIGTHFLWHVFNGTLLGVVILAFIRHGGPVLRRPGGEATPGPR